MMKLAFVLLFGLASLTGSAQKLGLYSIQGDENWKKASENAHIPRFEWDWPQTIVLVTDTSFACVDSNFVMTHIYMFWGMPPTTKGTWTVQKDTLILNYEVRTMVCKDDWVEVVEYREESLKIWEDGSLEFLGESGREMFMTNSFSFFANVEIGDGESCL